MEQADPTHHFPLVRFDQKITARYKEDEKVKEGQTYTFHWVGSTVVGVAPKPKWLPLYPSPK